MIFWELLLIATLSIITCLRWNDLDVLSFYCKGLFGISLYLSTVSATIVILLRTMIPGQILSFEQLVLLLLLFLEEIEDVISFCIWWESLNLC
jgi:hypothetical protein